jgi:hypothetical protein
MRSTKCGLGLAALLLLGVASPVRADTVRLKNGSVIEGVQAEFEGDTLRIRRETGSSVIPLDEVAEVTPGATRAQVLAEKKLAAGDDPAQLRAVAQWCADNRLTKEQKDLLALAQGIELDRKLATLEGSKTVLPFLVLARSMKGTDYSEAERRVVLRKALERDADNADVHAELGEVRYKGAWMPEPEARALAAAEEAKVMTARGFVRYNGQWVTPEQAASLEAARLADERAAAQRQADADALAAAEARARAAEEAARVADAERQAAEDAAAQAQAGNGNGYGYGYNGYGYNGYGYDASYGYGYPVRIHRVYVPTPAPVVVTRSAPAGQRPASAPAPRTFTPAPAPRTAPITHPAPSSSSSSTTSPRQH